MKSTDYLIIGAGPAGLQLAYFFEKKKRDYVVLEKANRAGDFFGKFPRHRKLISINKHYTGYDEPEMNMRWDWNSLLSDDPTCRLPRHTKEYFPNADYLVDYLNDYADQFKLNISYDKEVVTIKKIDDQFLVKTADGNTILANKVIVGTGIFQPYIPNIPGIELCENYVDCSVDVEDYNNQRVLIVGKGNSGFETADHLVGNAALIHIASPTPVKFAWETHFVGHLRAVNNNFIDTYQLKSQNAVIDADIEKIVKEDGKFQVTFKYAHANGEVESIEYDRILVSTGFRFDDTIFDENLKPELAYDDRFPMQTEEWESSNIRDLYFIGAIMQQRDFKKTTSAFIHGFRYNVECLYHLLENKYHNTPLPQVNLNYSPRKLTDHLIERINVTSSLWQQFGFICDLVVLDEEQEKMTYYDSVPSDYVMASDEWKNKHQFRLTLEYGKEIGMGNVLQSNRIRRDEIDSSQDSKFLHPIVRHYYEGKMVSEFHMIEVLEARWTDEEFHIKPLFEYIEKEMAQIEMKAMVVQKH